MAPTDVAGAVARNNWNNAGCFSPQQTMALTASDGTKPSGTTYENTINACQPYMQSGAAPATPDGKMMSRGVYYRDGQRHRIWNIPYARYDLYLYFSYAANGKNEKFDHSFIIRDVVDDHWIAGPFFARNMGAFTGTYTRLPTTSVVNDSTAPAANYLIVPNLTQKDLSIYLEIGPGRWPFTDGENDLSPLNGIQLVERTDAVSVAYVASPSQENQYVSMKIGTESVLIAATGTFEIIDLSGKIKMQTHAIAGRSIMLPKLGKGIYIAKITSRFGAFAHKIVVGK